MSQTEIAAATFAIKSIPFNEDYQPSEGTRITTNFANLARGDTREENLRNALRMIDSRFNALAYWDNPQADRYSVEIDIISVEMRIASDDAFPLIEILKTTVIDHKTGARIDGVVGNNFSSYVRDYDFSVVLPEHNKNQAKFSIPNDFGDLTVTCSRASCARRNMLPTSASRPSSASVRPPARPITAAKTTTP